MWEFFYVYFLENPHADPHSVWLVRIPTSDGNVFLLSSFPSVFVVFLMIVILTEQKEQYWRSPHTQSQVKLQSN